MEITSETQLQPAKFVPDYKYVHDDDLRKITVTQLAKLEADLHSLRLIFVANNRNPNTIVGPNKTIQSEMEKIVDTIKSIEEYFSEIIENED